MSIVSVFAAKLGGFHHGFAAARYVALWKRLLASCGVLASFASWLPYVLVLGLLFLLFLSFAPTDGRKKIERQLRRCFFWMDASVHVGCWMLDVGFPLLI
jgi:hypothetical protein